jgi:hypothetical protein
VTIASFQILAYMLFMIIFHLLLQYITNLFSSNPGKGKIFFCLLHAIQTGSGAHPASYAVGTGESFSEGKAAGA